MAAIEPITANWKINQVLQRDPALLEVLISAAPAFQRLRNPVLRRVQSRLVTVGQAAEIAGLIPDELVRRLNAALGIASADHEPVTAPATAPGAPPPWVETATIAVRLDARPFQQSGQEPFAAIMAAARQVKPGEVFALANTFEPTPLYSVLGQRGFAHWAHQHAADDWEILFYATGGEIEPTAAAPAQPVADQARGWDAPSATLTIDVSELVPPEPMIRILTALVDLPAGSSLLVRHVRRPLHLYPRLDELGYRHETRDLGPGRVEILIEKPGSPADSAA